MNEVAREAGEEQLSNALAPDEQAKPAPRQELTKAGAKGAHESPSTLHRTATALRATVPLLQKLLPLLDGNVGMAVANLLAPRLLSPPTVDLSPLETSLRKLRGDLAVIQDRNVQHDGALKRIDDQLETMKEAVERASLEQREIAEAVSRVRKNVLVFSLIGMFLVIVAIGLNAALFLYVKGSFH